MLFTPSPPTPPPVTLRPSTRKLRNGQEAGSKFSASGREENCCFSVPLCIRPPSLTPAQNFSPCQGVEEDEEHQEVVQTVGG